MNGPARRVAFASLVLLTLASSMAQAATCTWTGASSTAWGTAGNWSCAAVPGNGDDVIIDGASTPTASITAVPTTTVRSLQVVNNAQATLQAAAAVTLTLSNPGGTGLSVQAGAKLTLSGASAITIALPSGPPSATTGSISGAIAVAGGAHRLTAAAASGITFQSGAVFTADTGFTGNAFGTTNLNSIIFASGSTYVQKSSAASNPFGAGQPNSVVVFQKGSLYSQQSTSGLSLSGRTFANFELNVPSATVSGNGGAALSIDDLTVTAGTLNIGMTGTAFAIKGNVSVASGATLNFNPGSAATMTLGGSSAQTISGSGTLTFQTNQNLTVSNAAGIVFQRDVLLPGNLNLVTGDVTTGANVLTLGGVVTGGTGDIVGNARRTTFAAGTNYAFNNARTLVNFSSLTTAPTDLTFTLAKTAPAGLAMALPRTYTITPTGTPVFTATLQLGYLQADVDSVAGLTEATLAANRFGSGAWGAQAGSVDTTNKFVTATGVSAFSIWGIAPPPTPTLTINDVSLTEGDSGQKAFTFTVTVFPLAAGPVTFDISTADGTATTADADYVAKSLTSQTIPLGSGTYTFDVLVNGDTTLEPNETFYVNVTKVSGAVVGRGQGIGTIINDEPTPIHDIQGSGATSPLAGQPVKIRGIVVADYQGASPNLGGFFVEAPDAEADGNPLTSEGIFVYSNAPVSVGDRVEVDGTVVEYATTSSGLTSNLTEISSVTSVIVLSSGNPLPTPVPVSFPVAALTDLERYEGMLVTFPQTLTVVDNYDLGHYGSVTLSGTGRLWTPTHATTPGASAIALEDLNSRSRIVLDDASTASYPDPVVYPAPGLSATNTLRDGATVSGLVGVFDDRYGAYRVQPVGTVTFTNSNPRPTALAAPGTRIRAVSMNTLNYFNGNGTGGGFPTSRGATTLIEFNRQRAKTIAAMTALDADVYGLMEIENDAPPNSAIEDLVSGLNAATAPGTFAFIDTGVMGTDAIRSAIVYKPGRLTPVGAYAVLNQTVDPLFEDYGNRPTIAQTFQRVGTNARFTFVVNHLRSKGSCGSAGAGNTDTGDGQGCWNLSRTNAATAIRKWIGTDPTGSGDPDFLLVGDMNSYRFEDPITAFTSTGALTNVAEAFGGGYSYVYGGEAGYLDHALATPSLASQVVGFLHFHNNADEPISLDYNVENKSVGQVASYYSADAYRAADHDPIAVDIALAPLTADVSVTATATPNPVTAGTNLTYVITVANAGPDAAATTTWSDALPPGTAFVSLASPAGWTCTTPAVGAAGTVSCSNPSFAAGSAPGFTLTVAVDPAVPAGTTISNTAVASSSASDPVPANNSATATTTTGATSGVAIGVVGAPAPANAGGPLTYTVTLTNLGPSAATNVTWQDPLPAAAALASFVPAAGWSCTAPAVGASGTVSCSIATFPVGTATFTIGTTVAPTTAPGTTLTNTATITAVTGDTSAADNTSTTTTNVLSPALVAAAKTVSGTLGAGGNITYTIVLTNSGVSAQVDAPGNELVDVLPSTLVLSSATATSGTAAATIATNTVTWNGSIPAGGTVTITVVATVRPDVAVGTSISNQATIHYDLNGDGTNEATGVSDDPATPAANDATTFAAAAAGTAAIPTLDGLGLAALALLVALGGALLVGRRLS